VTFSIATAKSISFWIRFSLIGSEPIQHDGFTPFSVTPERHNSMVLSAGTQTLNRVMCCQERSAELTAIEDASSETRYAGASVWGKGTAHPPFLLQLSNSV
jgi:hypothetical protein